MAESLGVAVLELDANATPLDRKLNAAEAASKGMVERAGARLKNAGTAMVATGKTLTRGLTLPVVAAGAIVGKLAVDFDAAMRNVNSIAQLPESQFKKLRNSVLDLAGKTAQAPKTLAEGLYDLVSSGFNAKDSLLILKSSARAATAGLTDTATSTAAVAAVLNAYHLPASKAADVSDVLFRTVDRGVISFEQLASTVGDVLPFASSLHVSLREVGASVATMTKAGISAPETMTRIKAVMTSLLKPGKDLAKVIKEQGYESGEAMIRAHGFQGTLDLLAKATGGSKSEMAKLFPNVRALGGALALTGANAKTAHKDLDGMNDAAGATSRALGEQSKSAAHVFRTELAKLQAKLIPLGDRVLPTVARVVEQFVGHISRLVDWFQKLPAPMQTTIGELLLVAAAAGPLLTIFGRLFQVLGFLIGNPWVAALIAIGLAAVYVANHWEQTKAAVAGAIQWFRQLPGIVQVAAVALGALAAALAAARVAIIAVNIAMSVNPYVAAAAAIVALAYLIVTNWDKIKRATTDAWNFVKRNIATIAPALLSLVAGPIGALAGIVITRWSSIKAATTSAWNAVRSATASAWNAVRSTVSGAVHAVTGAVSGMAGSVKGMITGAWNAAKAATTAAIGAIVGVVSALPGRAAAALGGLGGALSGKVRSAFSAVKGALSSGISAAVGVISGAAGQFASAGAALITSFGNGIVSKANEIVGKVKSIVGKIRSLLPGSEPKDPSSPLRNLSAAGRALLMNIANGFSRVNLPGMLSQKMQNALDAAKNRIDSARSLFGAAFDRLNQRMLQAFDAVTQQHQTDAEKALAAIESRRQTEDLDRAIAQAQQDLRTAQQTGTAQDVTEAQFQLGRAQEDKQVAALQARAAAERVAWEQSRQNQRDALDDQLTRLRDHYAQYGATTQQGLSAITDIMAKYGISFTDAGDRLGDAFGKGLKGAVENAAGDMEKIFDALLKAVGVVQDVRKQAAKRKKPKHRAAGGPVSPRESYIVGEEGLELFTPQTTGRIIPLARLLTGRGGGETSRAASPNVTMQFGDVIQPHDWDVLIAKVGWRLQTG